MSLQEKPVLVLVESPFAGDIERNIKYARECARDCFLRNEYPFLSHLLYTQQGILDDSVASERAMGINAGLEWGKCAKKTVVYQDLGISRGMQYGIDHAIANNREVEFRRLYDRERS